MADDTPLDLIKRVHGPTVLPVGVYDADPPTIADGDTRPFQIDTLGNLKVAIAGGGASGPFEATGPGGEPLATLGEQETQTIALGDILTALGPLAKDVTLEQARDAVIALGDGATLQDIATALANVCTEATAQDILAELQTIVTRLDVALSTRASEATLGQARDELVSANVALADILADLGPLAKDVTVEAVEDAIVALGGGATLQQVVNAITNLLGGATETTLAVVKTVIEARLPAALTGGRLAVDVSDGSGPLTVDGSVNAAVTGSVSITGTPTVTVSSGNITVSGAVTATIAGTPNVVAGGPVAPGAVVGAEKPVLMGGTDGANAQMINVDSTGAVRLQSGGTPGAAAPNRVTQIGGTDGANLRAMSTDTAGRPNVNVVSSALPTGAATETTLGAVNTKIPSSASADPATTAAAVPVRQVPDFVKGRAIYATTNGAFANAANKLLFGFFNNTGATLYVKSIELDNAQTATIAGNVGLMIVQRSNAAITGGTTINNGSSPALVTSVNNPSESVPAGITWNTNGTLGGTVEQIEVMRWSTDELGANMTGLAAEIAALSTVKPTFDFSDDPIDVPNGYSLAVVTDANLTNGQTLVDFQLVRQSP